jgi:exonuclease VII small subunit
MPEIQVWDNEYHLLGSFADLNRGNELPSELRKRIEAAEKRIAALEQALGNSSGERNGNG